MNATLTRTKGGMAILMTTSTCIQRGGPGPTSMDTTQHVEGTTGDIGIVDEVFGAVVFRQAGGGLVTSIAAGPALPVIITDAITSTRGGAAMLSLSTTSTK